MFSDYLKSFEEGQLAFHNKEAENPYSRKTSAVKHIGWSDGYKSCGQPMASLDDVLTFMVAVTAITLLVAYTVWLLA